jgi:hypothetical protein
MAGVDHHGTIEAGFDAIIAGFFVAVVQMDGENGIREDIVGAADQTFEKALIGIGPGAFADLNDEGGLRLQVTAEKADNLFQVVDVVSADGIFAIRMLKQFFGCNDHFLLLKTECDLMTKT